MITRNLLELLSDKCEVVHNMLPTVADTDIAQTRQVERLCFAVAFDLSEK